MTSEARDEVDTRLLAEIKNIIEGIVDNQPDVDIGWDTDIRAIDMDSLEIMDFWFRIEQKFSVKVAEGDMDPLSPVSSLVSFLKHKGTVDA